MDEIGYRVRLSCRGVGFDLGAECGKLTVDVSEMISSVTRREHFCAACAYRVPGWTAEQNLAVFGPKSRLHGHNYLIEATVSGRIDPTTGMVIDLGLLKTALTAVLQQLDHRNLNEDVAAFADRVPTAENLARWIFGELRRRISAPTRLSNLRLYDGEDCWVDCSDG